MWKARGVTKWKKLHACAWALSRFHGNAVCFKLQSPKNLSVQWLTAGLSKGRKYDTECQLLKEMMKMPTPSPVLTKAGDETQARAEMRSETSGISLLLLSFPHSLLDGGLKFTESNTAASISLIYHLITDINVETTRHALDAPVMNEVPLKVSLSDLQTVSMFHFELVCSPFNAPQDSSTSGHLFGIRKGSRSLGDCALLLTPFSPHTWCQPVGLDLRVMSGRQRWAMSFTACGSVLLHIWIGKAEVSAGEQPGGVVSLHDLDHSFNQILHFVMHWV